MSEAREIEIERLLRDQNEEITRNSERLRAFMQVYSADRKADAAAREATRLHQQNQHKLMEELVGATARLVAEREAAPGFWAPVAKLISKGGWPAVVVCTSPMVLFAGGLLLWAAIETHVPLPTLILSILGVKT